MVRLVCCSWNPFDYAVDRSRWESPLFSYALIYQTCRDIRLWIRNCTVCPAPSVSACCIFLNVSFIQAPCLPIPRGLLRVSGERYFCGSRSSIPACVRISTFWARFVHQSRIWWWQYAARRPSNVIGIPFPIWIWCKGEDIRRKSAIFLSPDVSPLSPVSLLHDNVSLPTGHLTRCYAPPPRTISIVRFHVVAAYKQCKHMAYVIRVGNTFEIQSCVIFSVRCVRK